MKKLLITLFAITIAGCSTVQTGTSYEKGISSVSVVKGKVFNQKKVVIQDFTLSGDEVKLLGIQFQSANSSSDMPIIILPENISKLRIDFETKLQQTTESNSMPSLMDIMSGYTSSLNFVEDERIISVRNSSQSFSFIESDVKELIVILKDLEKKNSERS
jgi:hypothetical protein